MKKTKSPTTYSEIIALLIELKFKYPSSNMGRHLATALDDYNDIWGVTDKEMLFALNKYKANMEMDVPHETGEEELQRIIEDGLNLSDCLDTPDFDGE